MPQYLDPKNDLTFKRVFGEHKHLCMSLINSMLPLEKPVVDIEYKTGELIPELAKVLRYTIVDVRCTDSDNRQFLVEMQMLWTESFKSRVLLNASKAYVSQSNKGEDFELLHPVYSMNLVNDIFEKSPGMEDEYYHYYKIVNIKDTERQIEGLEFLFVELPKFKPQNRPEKKLYDLWLLFLTQVNESTTEIPQELLNNELTREAVEYMKTSAYTKEQLEAYDKRRIDVMTERGIINDALKKGEAIGLEKGEVIGIEKGEAIGEYNKAATITVKMAKKGASIAEISDMTGLSEQEIIEILKKEKLL
jgi:predicted transposase/invertase (TIGR01784 family)